MTLPRTAFGFLVLLGTFAHAQTGAGRVQGTVKDATGAVIPAARIRLMQTQTSVATDSTANEVGFFTFPAVQPGAYRLTASSDGMESWAAEFSVLTGQQVEIAPVLSVGNTATEITVTAGAAPLVTTTSATIANIVERARVDQLPLNGRFLQSLVQMTTPGIEGNSNSPRIYGQRDGSMEFLQDGVVLNDRNIGRLQGRPPGLDTVDEFRVETSVPGAKFSRPANVVLSTRSGSNEVHGSAFYTGRNNGFGVARRRQDFYEKPPQLIRNEYGWTLGGPVYIPKVYNGRNRTFFFSSWEGYKLRTAATSSTRLATQAMRNGDFSRLMDGQGRLTTIYDPWTTTGSQYTRLPFANNLVPMNRMSPFAKYVYSVTPLPTIPDVNPMVEDNYFAPDAVKQNQWTYTLRVDHRISDKDAVYGRYTKAYRDTYQRRGFNTAGNPITTDGYWNIEATPEWSHNAMGSWNHSFSPTFFVETVATMSLIDWQYSKALPSAQKDILTELGIPNPFKVNGAPRLAELGFNSIQYHGVLPRSQYTKIFSGEQNYNWVKQRHQLEFGWRYRRELLDTTPDRPNPAAVDFNSNATGLYDPSSGTAYNALPRTGHNVANFFIGAAALYSQTMPPPAYNMRSKEVSLYVQDNWKVTDRLHVNLGIRYDYLPILLDPDGVSSIFDMKTKSIVRPIAVSEMISRGYTTQKIADAFRAVGVKFAIPSEAGMSDGLVNNSKYDFSPRAGFAYRLQSSGRTVLRGGYGAFRFSIPARTFSPQRGNAPLQGTYSMSWNASNQSPDGRPNWLLRNAPVVIAGVNSADVLSSNAPLSIPRGVGINTLDKDLPTSTTHQWNLTLETEFRKNMLFSASYVGTASRNLEQYYEINGQANNYVWFATTGEPLPTGEYAGVARRVFDQQTYGDIRFYSKRGFSNYNGLTLQAQRRYYKGLAFQIYYVLSNAFSTGAIGSDGSDNYGNAIKDPGIFLPGAVPQNLEERVRFYNYWRDTDIPKHRVRYNGLVDLPFGKGKRWLSNARGFTNYMVGGWQLAASGSMSSRWMTLPTDNWGTLGDIEVYGKQYRIEDCRSGRCIPGYLYYNGYIPANRINSYDPVTKLPNGVMGVPASYRPAHAPINPIPANGGSSSDPNFPYYDSNSVLVRLKNGTMQRTTYDTGLHPWRNQARPGPWNFGTASASLFKVIPLTERVSLRLNMDFFNVLNQPGVGNPASGSGIISLRDSYNGSRELQWTARLSW